MRTVTLIQNLKTLRLWEYWNALLRFLCLDLKMACRQRPYHIEHTGSRLITAVKQRWAWLVLGWVTAWEHHVLLVFFFYGFFFL